jgi:hypothetical protein
MSKPILCLDLDGVIHCYSKGWQDGALYDEVTSGFWEWAERAWKKFHLVVYSSRSKTTDGLRAMLEWLAERATAAGLHVTPWTGDGVALRLLNAKTANLIILVFAHEKPPAFLTIDDRALQFRGDWSAWWLDPARLLQFQPWTVGKQGVCDPRPVHERALEKLDEVSGLLGEHDDAARAHVMRARAALRGEDRRLPTVSVPTAAEAGEGFFTLRRTVDLIKHELRCAQGGSCVDGSFEAGQVARERMDDLTVALRVIERVSGVR